MCWSAVRIKETYGFSVRVDDLMVRVWVCQRRSGVLPNLSTLSEYTFPIYRETHLQIKKVLRLPFRDGFRCHMSPQPDVFIESVRSINRGAPSPTPESEPEIINTRRSKHGRFETFPQPGGQIVWWKLGAI